MSSLPLPIAAFIAGLISFLSRHLHKLEIASSTLLIVMIFTRHFALLNSWMNPLFRSMAEKFL